MSGWTDVSTRMVRLGDGDGDGDGVLECVGGEGVVGRGGSVTGAVTGGAGAAWTAGRLLRVG